MLNAQLPEARYGATQVPPAPNMVTFEITTRCNLTCVMCPHGLPNGLPIKRDAPVSAVDSLIEQFDGFSFVHPTGVGEPLLAEGFWKIVDALAGRKWPKLIFNTNGMLLTDKNVERLMRCPINLVSVSIDAATPETYRKIRGSDMRKTLQGAKRMAEALKPELFANGGPTHFQVSMVLMHENIHEAPAFIDLAAEIGANIVYLEHLTEPHTPARFWTVDRDGFRFNYAEQSLLGRPELADPHVLKALDRADELGVRVSGPQLLLDPQNLHLLDRPSTKTSLEFFGD